MEGLVDALHAPGPDGDHADELSLFGRLIGSWRIEWSAPPGEPQLRWRIDQITQNGFRWRSEASRDGGQSWVLDEQMLATRMPA